jgi:ribose 5-phosphate isomerase
MSVEEYKRAAALKALEYVTDGMRLGIGTGSTADLFIQALGEKVARGLRIIGVATSLRSEVLARQHGIPLVDIDAAGILDLTVDGADEIDSDLRLIKGGGGALLREKIVASASNRVLIIADETKLVPQLGAFPLPVEISPFAWKTISRRIRDNLSHFDVGNAAAGRENVLIPDRWRALYSGLRSETHWRSPRSFGVSQPGSRGDGAWAVYRPGERSHHRRPQWRTDHTARRQPVSRALISLPFLKEAAR